jgi:hypothetical protein
MVSPKGKKSTERIWSTGSCEDNYNDFYHPCKNHYYKSCISLHPLGTSSARPRPVKNDRVALFLCLMSNAQDTVHCH